MMKKICTVLITLLAAASVSHAAPDITEGKWEITTKMEMPGMPMEMPPVTMTQCLTQKNMIPEDSDPGQECKTSDMKITGNTVSWTTTCSSGQDGPVTGSGNITYDGKTMKGTIKMKHSGMEMTSHIHGKYIGKCE